MGLTDKEKEQLLKDLWYNRNPCHDKDQEGNDRFWSSVLCVFNDYKKALKTPIYKVEVISISRERLYNKEIEGFENACKIYQDLKIKYLDTYASILMTEL